MGDVRKLIPKPRGGRRSLAIFLRVLRIRVGFKGELFPLAGDFDGGVAQVARGGRCTESGGAREIPAAPGTL